MYDNETVNKNKYVQTDWPTSIGRRDDCCFVTLVPRRLWTSRRGPQLRTGQTRNNPCRRTCGRRTQKPTHCRNSNRRASWKALWTSRRPRLSVVRLGLGDVTGACGRATAAEKRGAGCWFRLSATRLVRHRQNTYARRPIKTVVAVAKTLALRSRTTVGGEERNKYKKLSAKPQVWTRPRPAGESRNSRRTRSDFNLRRFRSFRLTFGTSKQKN